MLLVAVMRTLRQRAWRHKGEIVAIVVVVAIAAEAYLRLPVGRQLDYQPDPELTTMLVPGQQGLGPQGIRERVNRDGHRGKDTDWSAPVILAVGDSQGWGAGVTDDEVWTVRLEQQLKQHGDYADFQVVNASHPSHGPFHQYVRVRRVLDKHRIDLLLVRLSIEDRNFRPTPAAQVPQELAAAHLRLRVKQYNKLVPFLGKRALEQMVSIRALFAARTGKSSPVALAETGRRMWEEHGRWVEKIADLAEEHGVPLVFVHYDPTELPSSAVLQERVEQSMAARRDVYVFRLGPDAFDLHGRTPEARYREFRSRFVLPHDPHGNALQHERIGQAVHVFLQDRGLLAAAHSRRWMAQAKR